MTMDGQVSVGKHSPLVATETDATGEADASNTTKQDSGNLKAIRVEKYAYYSLFAANNGIGPYQ